MPALAEPIWSMGLGVESRIQRDVNPDQNSLKNMGELYIKMRLHPWAVLLETAQESHDSGSGTLQVQTESTSFGAWGRYELHDFDGWLSFVSVGAGSYFDKVDTSFQSSYNETFATRLFLGLGGGIGVVCWQHLSLELEGRVASVEQSREPVLSALLRLGYQI
jgi:hypothetical protein